MDMSTPIKEREVGARSYKVIEALSEDDALLVKAAHRCINAALDHSRAQKIRLVSEGTPNPEDPLLELPPKVLQVIARVLGLMGERKPIALFPRDHEMTTQEVAQMLNVSRPFVVKEIEAERLKCRMVGSHRRIPYEEFSRYRDAMKADQEQALQELADQAQNLRMGYD